jgi:hypothetical protein
MARGRSRKEYLFHKQKGLLIRSFGPPSPIALEARLRRDGEKGRAEFFSARSALRRRPAARRTVLRRPSIGTRAASS